MTRRVDRFQRRLLAKSSGPEGTKATRVRLTPVADVDEAIRFAEVCVLVLDATQLLEKQDLTIAREIAEEGRALVPRF